MATVLYRKSQLTHIFQFPQLSIIKLINFDLQKVERRLQNVQWMREIKLKKKDRSVSGTDELI